MLRRATFKRSIFKVNHRNAPLNVDMIISPPISLNIAHAFHIRIFYKNIILSHYTYSHLYICFLDVPNTSFCDLFVLIV